MGGRLSAGALLCAIFALGCETCEPASGPVIDEEPDDDSGLSGASGRGSSGAGAGGAGAGGVGSDDSGIVAGSSRIAIHAGRTALCLGECTELSAEATNGHAPSAYAWDPAIGDGAGPHTVCPDATTTYKVSARDTAIDEDEFTRPDQVAEASIAIEVDGSSDCEATDGGQPEPNAKTCSIAITYEDALAGAPLFLQEVGPVLATDAERNLYMVGNHRGQLDLGDGMPLERQGYTDAFVVKYDSRCRRLWTRSFGAPQADVELTAVGVGPSGEVVVGGALTGSVTFDNQMLSVTAMSILLMSLDDADGSVSWALTNDSTSGPSRIGHLAIDDSGEIALHGQINGALSIAGEAAPGAASAPTFLAKVSAGGRYRYARRLTNTSFVTPLAVSRNGMVALSGWTDSSMPIAIGDEAYSMAPQGRGRYVMMLDSIFPIWTHLLEADVPTDDVAWPAGTVAFDPDGNVVVEHGNLGEPVGLDQPERISKIDVTGEVVWTRDVTPSDWVPTREVEGMLATDAEGNILHTYEIANLIDPIAPGYATPPDDVVVQKLAPDGLLVWKHTFDSGDYENVFGLTVAPNGSVWVGHAVEYSTEAPIGMLYLTKLPP